MPRDRRRGSGSWRDGQRKGKEKPQGTRSLRWLLTLLAAGMVIVFAVALYNPFRKDRWLFTIPVWTNDQLATPPGAYLREDIDAFGQLPEDVKVHPPALAMQTAEDFQGLGAQLKNGISSRTDLVMLYIAAHGISYDGQPYLICSQFKRSRGADAEGLHPLRDVLMDLASCAGSHKLLILDCGRIAYDPSLGIVVNEFPQLVLDELQQPALLQALGRQELWVMLPCTTFERSAVAHTLGRSVFGGAVSEALAGKANQWPEDSYVTLFELYQYTFRQSSQWFTSDSGASLTPLLMKAGVGLVAPSEKSEGDKKHRLVWLDGKQGEPEEAAAEPEPAPAVEDAEGSAEADAAKTARRESRIPGRPVVLRTDRGAFRDDRGLVYSLVMFQAPAETAAPPDTAPATDQPPATGDAAPAAKPTEAASEPQPTARPPAPATATPAAVAPPAEETDDKELSPADRLLRDIKRALHAAWQLRDRIEAAENNDGCSPIHFAPHAWREANATLLSYEQRLYLGRTVQSEYPGDPVHLASLDNLLRNIGKLASDLALLETALGQPAESRQGQFLSTEGQRLAKSFERYRQQVLLPDQPRRIKATPLENDLYRSAWEFDRLAYAARNYVRWHAAASVTSSSGVPLRSAIEKWLDDLNTVQTAFDLLQQRPVKPNGHTQVYQIIQAVADLVNQRQAIDEELTSLANNALDNIRQPFYQQQIEDLLSTPVLAADLRMRLVNELTKPAEPLLTTPRSQRDFPRQLQPTPQQWQRLVERLQLEEKLWLLADPAAAAILQAQIKKIAASVHPVLQVDAALWTACRELGDTLGKLTAELADADQHRALRLADPRDAADVKEVHPFYSLRIEFQQPIDLRISGADAEQLDRSEPRRITLTLAATQEELLRTVVEVAAAEQLVKLVEVAPRGPQEIRDGWFSQTVAFDASALMNQEQARVPDTDVEFRVRWFDANLGAQREDMHAVRLTLPRPNRLDLEVLRFGGSEFLPDNSSAIDLALYPNRRTQYQFSLVNGSGVVKQVDVALYAIPAETAGAWRPGRISTTTRDAVYDAKGTKLVNATLVAKTAKPVELSADEMQRALIDFVPPGTPAAPPADSGEAAPPAPAPAEPPTPAAAPDVSRGLLCVITNADNPKDQHFKWIELTPLAPRIFLEPEVGYDYKTRRLVARLRAKDMDGDDRPDLPGGAPVRISWDDPAGQIPSEAQKRLSGVLDTANGQLELYAQIPPDNQLRTISLSVDDHPRAFLFEVPCDEQSPASGFRPGKDLGATRIEAQINSLSVPGDAREFHYDPYVNLLPLDQRDDKIEYVLAKRDQAAALPAPCSVIHLTFQVDAPVDAFRDTEDQVVVTLGDDIITPLRFYADRRMVARLTKAGPQGLVELETEISDYQVDLAPGDLENLLTYVEVGVRLPRLGDRRDRANVILDSDKPTITKVAILLEDGSEPKISGGRPQMAAGQRLIARVYVKDTTGLGRATYGFLDPGQRDLNPAKAAKFASPGAPDFGGGSISDLPVATKDLPPGLHTLKIEVADWAKHQAEKPAEQVVEIKDPQAMPQLGVIKGRIGFGPGGQVGVNGALFTLALVNASGAQKPVQVGRDGSFSIKDVPAGEYTLEAKGLINNQPARGSLPGVKPWAPDAQNAVVVIVSQ